MYNQALMHYASLGCEQKAVHAEPSPLVINNMARPLKVQRCKSFPPIHYSHSSTWFQVSKSSCTLYYYKATENLQPPFWSCFALGSICILVPVCFQQLVQIVCNAVCSLFYSCMADLLIIGNFIVWILSFSYLFLL